MDEFKAAKIGEVIAFSRIGLACREKAGPAFDTAFKNETAMGNFTEKLREFEEAAAENGNEITTRVADQTTEKLKRMMETYIGDDWDDPVEVLEWLGFYFGAAVAHWAIIVGMSSMDGENNLRITAEEAVAYHKGSIEVVAESMRQVGVQKTAAAR